MKGFIDVEKSLEEILGKKDDRYGVSEYWKFPLTINKISASVSLLNARSEKKVVHLKNRETRSKSSFLVQLTCK